MIRSTDLPPELDTLRILELADFVEKLPQAPAWGDSFDMTRWHRTAADDCGTAACLAGWAVHLFEGQAICINYSRGDDFVDRKQFNSWKAAGGYALGLNQNQSQELFTPMTGNYPKITGPQAARVLRHLAGTGEVDWTKAEEEVPL